MFELFEIFPHLNAQLVDRVHQHLHAANHVGVDDAPVIVELKIIIIIFFFHKGLCCGERELVEAHFVVKAPFGP